MSYPVLTALPVGQGNGYLLEVYDKDQDHEDRKLTYLALVDFGSISKDSFDSAHRKNSREYVWEKMGERYQNLLAEDKPKFNDHYLDTFLLTHQDWDHWNELQCLINEKLENHTIKKGDDLFKIKKKECYTKIGDTYTSINWHTQKRCYDTEKITTTLAYSNDRLKRCCISNELFTSRKEEISNYSITLTIKEVCQKKSYILKALIYVGFKEEDIINISVDDKYCFKIKNKQYCIRIDQNSDEISIIRNIIVKVSEKLKKVKAGDGIFDIDKNITIKSLVDIKKELNVEKEDDDVKPIINKSFYCGANYGFSALNFLDFIDALSKQGKQEISSNYNGRDFCVISANEYVDENSVVHNKEYNVINASSAVTLWDFDGNGKFLFTGDATVHTMLKIINKNLNRDYKNAIMTAPHHGSDNTSRGREKTDTTNDEYAILEKFLNKLAPAAIEISSGHESQFHHPGENFIKKCLNILAELNEKGIRSGIDHGIYFFQYRKTVNNNNAPSQNALYGKQPKDSGRENRNKAYRKKQEQTKEKNNKNKKEKTKKVFKSSTESNSSLKPIHKFFKTENHLYTNVQPYDETNKTPATAKYVAHQLSMKYEKPQSSSSTETKKELVITDKTDVSINGNKMVEQNYYVWINIVKKID